MDRTEQRLRETYDPRRIIIRLANGDETALRDLQVLALSELPGFESDELASGIIAMLALGKGQVAQQAFLNRPALAPQSVALAPAAPSVP